MMTLIGAQAVFALTAAEQLKAAPKPNFREGHTLIPLSRWGWTMSVETRIELTENWGYALEFGSCTASTVKELDNTNSIPARLVALTASNPKKYPLCVLTDRPLLDPAVVAKLPDGTWCHKADGSPITNAPQWKLWSPEAPDEVFKMAAEGTADPLKKIREKTPIAVILNGGEYGLNVYGHSGPCWQQDPKVLKAKGEKSWYEYVCERKARQELIISEAVRAVCPDRQAYIWYHFGGMPTWDSWQWSNDYKAMRKVSDYPDHSLYYMEFNSGWTGNADLLSKYLSATAQAIDIGDPLSYNWVCGGWLEGKFSDRACYMGFLKCLYTGGMIGGAAGYFSHPKGGFAGDLGQETPSWLSQMMDLGHVQALFSHLDDFLRQGYLLPGPDKHRQLATHPAYEFPTGFPNARVLVRKHRQRDEWLVTAWAADGVERDVTVDVPALGKVTVKARPCGSVYRAVKGEAKGGVSAYKLMLIDQDGLLPSKGL
ncbi:MAG: hypothetical protein HY343_04845 [Lentisphaerae bacterium]|nr:hypothetical protein [Lentisphaerota bacterium]